MLSGATIEGLITIVLPQAISRGEAARHQLQRRVPRDDLADDAEGLAARVVEARAEVLVAALDAAGEAREVLEVDRRGRDLHARLADRDAGIQ